MSVVKDNLQLLPGAAIQGLRCGLDTALYHFTELKGAGIRDESRYVLVFSGDKFSRCCTHVCTGYLPTWGFHTVYALGAARHWFWDSSTRSEATAVVWHGMNAVFCSGILEFDEQSSWTQWQGREGTAELELLTALLPTRNPGILAKCNTASPAVPIELALRKHRAGDLSGGPWRYAYGANDMGATSPAGWCVWLCARRLGIVFPEYSWPRHWLPLAGVVLREALSARVPPDVLAQCLEVYRTQFHARTAYKYRAARVLQEMSALLAPCVEDGYLPPHVQIPHKYTY